MRCDEWPLTPIGDVARIFDGPHATPKPTEDGPIFLGIGNVTEEGRLDLSDIRHIAEEDFAQWTRRTTPSEGDVVFSYEASLHRYGLIQRGFHGCLGRRMALVRPQQDRLNSQFLLYYFLSPEWRGLITSNTLAGATVDRVPLTKFPEFPVRIPPLPIQRRIASILSAYDDLIENHRKRIAILEDMARRLYREWFVHYRYPGHESVPLVESPLGRIPQGWEVRRFGEVIALNYGKALKAEERKPGSVPVYGSSGVVGFHSEALEAGPGLIVGRKGNVGSLHWSDGPFYPIDTVYFASSSIFPLRYLLHSMACMNFLNNDAAVPGLSRQQAYGLDVVVPPQEPLRQFCEFAESWGQLASNLMRQTTVLRRTRDLLLPRLMSGTLSVEALAIAEAAAP